ncbi:hypothetical protein RJ639_045337 [Escallonia herrerae]|uniref:Stress response protein NST1 n=1 Tax=Escallonia herrerae TaxID=1293975 RepID=A0AA89AZ78_9ASTE|nr:hypothetical protein RJ639_045337 [Escallonia herrerae]
MPGLAQQQRNDYQFCNVNTSPLSCSNGSVTAANGFWSKHRDDVSYNQLQKFWSDLSLQARQELLRIDKQTLFEQARKNMYCSRCNGLLLEGFLQIVMYGKSLQHEGAGGNFPSNRLGASLNQSDDDLRMTAGCQDDIQDPSVHPWGGLTTTRDGTLTLLDNYMCSKSLKALQNVYADEIYVITYLCSSIFFPFITLVATFHLTQVFDSARARERERELLYPDACGGGGRGWISQGMAGYGRGHGTRETCALHTARLSVDTLVDFWSALGEETRQSLLKMKEEDFIERLMYRFDSKRFCRDCRRNVIREFKELKELKRIRREPRCTSWFCVADTGFQYEVSHDTVQADWHQTFIDTFGTYHHFEWAVGTGEGKSDILEFENVGLSGRVQVNGLDLSGLNACYITLRAWKMDGRCTELSVKAHALKGQQCVHCRLVVGDGYVTITRGESIKRFFEHAEEAEEEEVVKFFEALFTLFVAAEKLFYYFLFIMHLVKVFVINRVNFQDDDSMDKDGNELDGECSRPQKHAKSPELAREFLLDAATVIFKEQVEKAFREGTARQNAHSIFVSLALKLLEERVHVACKEIITLEKQMKLLEEEEKEKREEEERKERRRTKEREKKLRRKERLREKEKDREKKCSQSDQHSVVPEVLKEDSSPSIYNEPNVTGNGDLVSEAGEAISSRPISLDIHDEQFFNGYISLNMQSHSDESPDGEFANVKDGNGTLASDQSSYSRRKLRFSKEPQIDVALKWADRRRFAVVSESGGLINKSEPRYHGDYFETASRSTNGSNNPLRSTAKSNTRIGGSKFGERLHCSNHRMGDRYEFHACSCSQHNEYRPKVESHFSSHRVGWEAKSVCKSESACDVSKPYYRGNMRESCGRPKSKIATGNNALPHTKKVWEPMESQKKYPRSSSDSDVTLKLSSFNVEATEPDKLIKSTYHANVSDEISANPRGFNLEDNDLKDSRTSTEGKSLQYSKEPAEETHSSNGTTDLSMSSASNSDSCSSCPSEGDSNSSSLNPQNPESSLTSDSEDASPHSEGREPSLCLQNGFSECPKFGMEKTQCEDGGQVSKSQAPGSYSPGNLPMKSVQKCDKGKPTMGSQPQGMLPPLHTQSMHFPMFQAPSMGYYHQGPVAWPAAPANGLMPLPHPNHYVLASPYAYGLNGNSRFMQYGALQHLTPPVLNQAPAPVYHPVGQANGINLKEHTKISDLSGVREAHYEANRKGIISKGQILGEALPSSQGEHNGNSEKSQMGNSGFSLFHFGGPIALSTGYQPNPEPSKEGNVVDLSSSISVEHTDADHACNKKDAAVEEYNLFAASNGMRFSFF